MANGYASVAPRGRPGKRGGGQPCPSRPLWGVLGGGWRERVAGDGGESSSVSARGASIGLSVQACRLVLLPELCRSKAEASSDAVDGGKPATASACGGRLGGCSGRRWLSSPDQPAWRSPCSIYLGQFDHQSGGDKRGHARERVKGWASGFQGGSSSIIEAISIRSSGFLADQQCCPLPSSINSCGAGRPAESC